MTKLSLLSFVVVSLAACQLRVNGRPVGEPRQPPPQAADAPPPPSESSSRTVSTARPAVAHTRPVKSRAPAFDERAYQQCVAQFDAGYAAWLPNDQDAKAAIAKVAGKSPYVAMPVLLAAYEKVDAIAAPRQTGNVKPGSEYAAATRQELATAMVELAARTHAPSCVNNQHQIEVDHEYMPAFTGDRDKDKIVACGGPSEEERLLWLDARTVAAAAFNTPNRDLHDHHVSGGSWAKVTAFSQSSKEAALTLTTMSGNRRCVANGRYGTQGDGSWGPLCDWEELPAYAVGDAKPYRFAPQELPFKLQRGDEITLSFELDPDAPAGNEKVARRGGWWWLTSVTRGKVTVFEMCATQKAHQAEVRSVLAPLQIMSRK